MYAQDYDGVLPYDSASFRTIVLPYVQKQEAFTCPLDPPGSNSYLFNTNLASVSTHTVQVLDQTILIYEGKAAKLNYRHEGHASVVFVDGHCKLIGSKEAAALLWTAPTPIKK